MHLVYGDVTFVNYYTLRLFAHNVIIEALGSFGKLFFRKNDYERPYKGIVAGFNVRGRASNAVKAYSLYVIVAGKGTVRDIAYGIVGTGYYLNNVTGFCLRINA